MVRTRSGQYRSLIIYRRHGHQYEWQARPQPKEECGSAKEGSVECFGDRYVASPSHYATQTQARRALCYCPRVSARHEPLHARINLPGPFVNTCHFDTRTHLHFGSSHISYTHYKALSPLQALTTTHQRHPHTHTYARPSRQRCGIRTFPRRRDVCRESRGRAESERDAELWDGA